MNHKRNNGNRHPEDTGNRRYRRVSSLVVMSALLSIGYSANAEPLQSSAQWLSPLQAEYSDTSNIALKFTLPIGASPTRTGNLQDRPA